MLRQHVGTRVFDAYCSAQEYWSLVRYGVETAGLNERTVENALDMELERLGAANEARLLQELEGALGRFTGADRKLDKKDRVDALQLVCRARPGFRCGLKPGVAEAAIDAYCRANAIKVKTGLFSWGVP